MAAKTAGIRVKETPMARHAAHFCQACGATKASQYTSLAVSQAPQKKRQPILQATYPSK